jgi:hypothetical protein
MSKTSPKLMKDTRPQIEDILETSSSIKYKKETKILYTQYSNL